MRRMEGSTETDRDRRAKESKLYTGDKKQGLTWLREAGCDSSKNPGVNPLITTKQQLESHALRPAYNFFVLRSVVPTVAFSLQVQPGPLPFCAAMRQSSVLVVVLPLCDTHAASL